MSAATMTGDIPPAWNCFGVPVTIRLLILDDNMLLDNVSSLLVTGALAKYNSSCSEWELQLIQVLWCLINFRFEENQVCVSLSFHDEK